MKIQYSGGQFKAAESSRSGESYSRFAKKKLLYLSQVVNLKCWSQICFSQLYFFLQSLYNENQHNKFKKAHLHSHKANNLSNTEGTKLDYELRWGRFW